jgi:hypothetical protein
MQHFNPWAGGDGTFLILSHLQLDSKYEKQWQWHQRAAGDILSYLQSQNWAENLLTTTFNTKILLLHPDSPHIYSPAQQASRRSCMLN